MTLLGSAAVAWPGLLRAQQTGGARHIGVLMAFAENDREGAIWLSRFTQGLQELGWIDGRNVALHVRWGAGDPERIRTFAKELVSLQPDAILSHGTPVTRALHRETRAIPVVFVTVGDPVGDGFIANLYHPGGNFTGFIFVEAEMGGKWLELLAEVVPNLKRAAAMFNPDTAPHRGEYYLPSFEAAARSRSVEPITMPVRNSGEIESDLTSLGNEPGSGFVAMGDPFLLIDRKSLIDLATRKKVPAIYFHAVFARDGGLFSYGPDNGDIFHRAAVYVDRIFHGEKPAELPVQVPTKFEMVLNLKAAKALGLEMPLSLQQLADEIIE